MAFLLIDTVRLLAKEAVGRPPRATLRGKCSTMLHDHRRPNSGRQPADPFPAPVQRFVKSVPRCCTTADAPNAGRLPADPFPAPVQRFVKSVPRCCTTAEAPNAGRLPAAPFPAPVQRFVRSDEHQS